MLKPTYSNYHRNKQAWGLKREIKDSKIPHQKKTWNIEGWTSLRCFQESFLSLKLSTYCSKKLWNRMKTWEKINSSEYFTNSQAHGSNDRAFSGTSMQQHHQGFKDFSFFFNFNRICIISKSFSITTSDQPTHFSSSTKVFIEEWEGEIW